MDVNLHDIFIGNNYFNDTKTYVFYKEEYNTESNST